jgi:pseudouridine kinase
MRLSASPPPVVCIGGALIDRKYRLHGPVDAASSNPAALTAAHGGVARNVAENLARLGATVHLAAAVGDDAAGRDIAARLAGAGVDLGPMRTMPDAPTSEYAAILAHDTGDLVLAAVAMDAAERCMDGCIDDVLARLPAGALLFAEPNLSAEALGKVARHAAAVGATLALGSVSVAKAARLPRSLAGVALVVMNAEEAAACLGRADAPQRLAAGLFDRGAAAAVVTAGPAGAALADDTGSVRHPAIPVEVADVTGAGDALTAALLWRMTLSETPHAALRWGMAAAALTASCRAAVHPDLSPAFLAAALSPMPKP